MIKLKSPLLYAWVRNYLTGVGAYRDGGYAGDLTPVEDARSLYKLMSELGWHQAMHHSALGIILPGVASFARAGEDQKVYQFAEGELSGFERDKRLGSPTHWRLYFAFDLPSYALSDEEIVDFLRKSAEGGEGAATLRELLARPHPRRGHFIDVLLDRLRDIQPSISLNQSIGMLDAFGETMDEIAATLGNSEIWRKALRLLTKDVAEHFVRLAVKNGASLNWFAEVLRDQGSALGLPEGRQERPDRQWLSKDQLVNAVATLTSRFNIADPSDIFDRPSPLDILFCWKQLGNENDATAFVNAAIADDEGLVHTMHGMRGWSASSNEIRRPLHREYVEQFTDANVVKSRLAALADNTRLAPLNEQAAALLLEWVDEQR
jgi:hypothetical protein